MSSRQSDSVPSFRRRLLRGTWRCARTLLIAYLLIILLLMFFEESLIFPAPRYPNGDWTAANIERQEVTFQAADGTQLHGWYFDHPRPRAHILYCHGNAENVAYLGEFINALRRDYRVAVFVFDYRGYGKSEGRASERGVLEDGRAAHSWLADRAGRNPADLVLMGRSLGGGVAVDLAAQHGARGLILENTFSSIPDVAAWHYPWLPVKLLIRTKFDSQTKIARYHGPLLQTHGDEDEIIPFESGRRLFEACPSSQKRFITDIGGEHNKSPSAEYLQALDEFLSSIHLESQP